MSSIPLDLQRKFERRWAAQFSPDRIRWPGSKSISLKGRINGWLRRPRKRKTRRIKPAGLRSAPAT